MRKRFYIHLHDDLATDVDESSAFSSPPSEDSALMKRRDRVALLLAGLAAADAAYAPMHAMRHGLTPVAAMAPPPRLRAPAAVAAAQSVVLPLTDEAEGPKRYGPHLKIKGKVLNWFGALYVIQALALGVIWSLSMSVLHMVCSITGWDPHRKWYDWTGKQWSRLNMWLGGCAPRVISGLEHLPKEGEAALLCANHASWFDIPLIGQIVPTTFKFVASKPLEKLPLIGQQLVGGKHVLIDRTSRKGQLASFKASLSWLAKGVAVMAFPEGTRTKTGRMNKFKGGTFAMATKANAPIIPITLVGTFAMYPPEAMLPLRPTRNLEIHVHPPIDPEGKTEKELEELTRLAIQSKLPPECH